MFKIIIKDKENTKKNIYIDKKKYSFYSGKTYLSNFLIVQDVGQNFIKDISYFCGIGQCQKCIIKVNNETRLACLTLPKENDDIRSATQNIK
jgi:succinate dehydrogenase/fumarate reductase-like Fe-S protein